jgi:hypothetical protein
VSILTLLAIGTELAITANSITTTIIKANNMAAGGDVDGAVKLLEDARDRYKAASDSYRNTENPNDDAGS